MRKAAKASTNEPNKKKVVDKKPREIRPKVLQPPEPEKKVVKKATVDVAIVKVLNFLKVEFTLF